MLQLISVTLLPGLVSNTRMITAGDVQKRAGDVLTLAGSFVLINQIRKMYEDPLFYEDLL
nr:hypothetical protein [Peribacillus deserti]